MYRVWEYPVHLDRPYKHVELKRSNKVNAAERKRGERSAPSDERFFSSLFRTKRRVIDVTLCNKFELFCTFTFDSEKVDRFNYNEVRKKLAKWFNNFKNRYAPDFEYFVIPEFHKDGAVHFHGCVKGIPSSEFYMPENILKRLPNGELKLVPNTKRYVSWLRYQDAFGHFNCSYIRNHVGCAFYISKYVTKDLVKMPAGSQLLMCSKGLKKPELVFDGEGSLADWVCDVNNEWVRSAFLPFEKHDFMYNPADFNQDYSAVLKDYKPAACLTFEQLRLF